MDIIDIFTMGLLMFHIPMLFLLTILTSWEYLSPFLTNIVLSSSRY